MVSVNAAGRNGEFGIAAHPVARTDSIQIYCMIAQLGLTLASSKFKGDDPCDGPIRSMSKSSFLYPNIRTW